MPMMNPSPTEIVELFTFVEVTLNESLIQYATVAGHFPGVTATSAKAKRKKVNKVEVAAEDQPKGEPQTHAVTPKPQSKGQGRGSPPVSPPKDPKPSDAKKGGKGGGKGKRNKSESRPEKRKQQCIPFLRGICKMGDQCNYEHQVDDEGKPIPVGPEKASRYTTGSMVWKKMWSIPWV